MGWLISPGTIGGMGLFEVFAGWFGFGLRVSLLFEFILSSGFVFVLLVE
jgi:hypothetical protein